MKNGILVFAVSALAPAALFADSQDYVTVNATASPAYVRQKTAGGAPKPERYVFFQGKFFGGGTRDPSLAHVSFADIAKVLATNLAKQSYFPTKDMKAADLLIVVNWGTTTTEPGAGKSDTERQFQLQELYDSVNSYNAGTGDVSDITANLMVARANQLSSQAYTGENAKLLGYTGTLQKEDRMSWASLSGVGATEEAHLADLTEERYFVILLAYDYQKLRRKEGQDTAHPAKQGEAPPQPAPIWSVRMNIASDGNNFTQALPAMSRVAADYFGKQMDGLKTEQTDLGRHGTVDIGETKVLSTVK